MGWSGNWSRGGNGNLDWYFFKKSNKLKRKEKKAYIRKKKCSVSPKTKQEHLNCRKAPVGTGEMVGLWGRKVRLWKERVNRMLHMRSYIHRHVRTYIHEHNHERTNIIQFLKDYKKWKWDCQVTQSSVTPSTKPEKMSSIPSLVFKNKKFPFWQHNETCRPLFN